MIFGSTKKLGELDFRIGQEGINDEFMISNGATVMVNSSFGFPAWAALDLPSGAPNYPLAAPFVRATFTPDQTWTAMLGVFDGNPSGPGTNNPQVRNASGTLFRVSDPALVVGEVWYSINQGRTRRAWRAATRSASCITTAASTISSTTSTACRWPARCRTACRNCASTITRCTAWPTRWSCPPARTPGWRCSARSWAAPAIATWSTCPPSAA